MWLGLIGKVSRKVCVGRLRAEAGAVAHVDHMGVFGQAVQQCCSELLVLEKGAPILKSQVSCNDRRLSAMAHAHQMACIKNAVPRPVFPTPVGPTRRIFCFLVM